MKMHTSYMIKGSRRHVAVSFIVTKYCKYLLIVEWKNILLFIWTMRYHRTVKITNHYSVL